MLTVLDVVNQCLATMSLTPILESEIEDNPFAQAAVSHLSQAHMKALARGWWFNEVAFEDIGTATVLRVEGPPGTHLSWRNGQVYDHMAAAVVSPPPAGTLAYIGIPFDECAVELQAYSAAVAVATFQAEFDGSDTRAKLLGSAIEAALAEAQAADRRARISRHRLRECLRAGWWFNRVEFSIVDGTPAVAGTLVRVQGGPNLLLDLRGATIWNQSAGAPFTGSADGVVGWVDMPLAQLPQPAQDWVRAASAFDIEREALAPSPRVLADLAARMEELYADLRRESLQRVQHRQVLRELLAMGWWFNEVEFDYKAEWGTEPPWQDILGDDFLGESWRGLLPLKYQLAASDTFSSLYVTDTAAYFALQTSISPIWARAYLLQPSTSGDVHVDLRIGGESILTAPIVIPQGSVTSVAALSQPRFRADSYPEGAVVTVAITQPGTGAIGLNVAVFGVLGG